MRTGQPIVLVSAHRQQSDAEDADTFSMIYNLSLLVIFLVIVAVVIWQIVKRTRAMNAPISDDECVSCGSKNVTVLGPGNYRCNECEYEGGSGMAAKQNQEQLDRINQMDPAARHASGVTDLHEARTLLLSMLGAGVTIGESSSAIGVAQSNLAQAKQHLQMASLKLNDSYLAVQPTGGESAAFAGAQVATALDSQAVVGGVAESLLAMGNLDVMKSEATALLQRIDAALAHHAGEQPPA